MSSRSNFVTLLLIPTVSILRSTTLCQAMLWSSWLQVGVRLRAAQQQRIRQGSAAALFLHIEHSMEDRLGLLLLGVVDAEPVLSGLHQERAVLAHELGVAFCQLHHGDGRERHSFFGQCWRRFRWRSCYLFIHLLKAILGQKSSKLIWVFHVKYKRQSSQLPRPHACLVNLALP